MVDVAAVEADLAVLVRFAVEAATSLEELIDAARAAAALGAQEPLEMVAEKVAAQVKQALSSAGAWEAELTYEKIDAWSQTGHRARMLAEAWSIIAPAL